MPNKAIEGHWEVHIRTLAAEHPRWGAKPIARELEALAELDQKLGTTPSERTIARRLDTIRERPEELARYRLLRWPEAMIEKKLPWEASRNTLDLLAWLHADHRPRPLISVGSWFHRVTLAALDDAPIEARFKAACWFAAFEVVQVFDDRRVEWYLAFAPWRKGPERLRYEEATAGEYPEPDGVEPVLPWSPDPNLYIAGEGPRLPNNLPDEIFVRVVESLSGFPIASTVRDEIMDEKGSAKR